MLAWIFGDCRESQNRQGSDWQIFTTEETAYTIKCAKNDFPFRNVLTRKFLKCYNVARGTADWCATIMEEPPQLELSTGKG